MKEPGGAMPLPCNASAPSLFVKVLATTTDEIVEFHQKYVLPSTSDITVITRRNLMRPPEYSAASERKW